ncbi:ubiquitin carboxyl-terminal hydrolase 30 [Denticeps clupeoides]|uniref:ubiquitin carboxyl-terminal hydrolase 30 n=1 Tax=Denticeps clupeoides TaxID=299321 RepID=UPI0010A4A433|nr:ubiquitin carboxyl-terminal hydrolase 30 [Denticeps clupeoides]
MARKWGLVAGVAAAVLAGVYVLWGPGPDRRKRRTGAVPGLRNLGNTCFMNALLQGLAACPSFISWLEDRQGPGRRLARTLLRLLRALSGRVPAGDVVLDAGCLLLTLRLYRWRIHSFEEQDAHELFHVLTDSLEEERGARRPAATHLFDMSCLETSPDSAEKNLLSRVQGPLPPVPSLWRSRHPFHGHLTSFMACKCCKQQSPLRYDSFDSLSLSIPSVSWGGRVTLDHCLQHFISSETIKEVECVNCTKMQAGDSGRVLQSRRSTFTKQLKLGKMPQCLCIHLQRLTWSNDGTPCKRQEHVQFSEFLSMDRYKFCTSSRAQRMQISRDVEPCSRNNGAFPPLLLDFNLPCTYSSEYLYRLMSMLVHHGDVHSGHFVTYRRCPSPFSAQWLWVSDDSVRRASLQEALSSNAYLLFYERVQKKQTPSL